MQKKIKGVSLLAYSARHLLLRESKCLEGLGERTSEFVQSLILVHRHSHMHMLSEGLGGAPDSSGPAPRSKHMAISAVE